MTSDEIRAKAKETAKSVSDLLDAVKRTAHARLVKEAPKVVDTIDQSFDRASKGLTDALKDLDKRTSKEQSEVLKAYRSFLQKQTEIIDKKMASIRRTPKEDEPA